MYGEWKGDRWHVVSPLVKKAGWILYSTLHQYWNFLIIIIIIIITYNF
jgi:hypothetical protein